MTKLEKLIYIIALAFWRAYFDALMESKAASEERPNEEDRVRANRFRDAVRKLRSQGNDPGSVSSP